MRHFQSRAAIVFGSLLVIVLGLIGWLISANRSDLGSGVGSNATTEVANKMYTWNGLKDGNPKAILIGELKLVFSLEVRGGTHTVKLSVFAPDGSTAVVRSVPDSDATSATFGVGKLDGSSDFDQIIFSTWSGGAPCCNEIVFLDRQAHGWREAHYEGDSDLSVFPRDVDGDGIAEIVLADDRFKYQFTDGANSWLPLQIYNLKGGSLVDASREAKNAHLFADDLTAAVKRCNNHDGNQNGACAAYVADASRLGLLDLAWSSMLENYDHQVDPKELPARCALAVSNHECPQNLKQISRDFPASLAWFLVEKGYISPAQAVRVLSIESQQVIGPKLPFDLDETLVTLKSKHPEADCVSADSTDQLVICNLNTGIIAQTETTYCPVELLCGQAMYHFTNGALDSFNAFFSEAEWKSMMGSVGSEFGEPTIAYNPPIDRSDLSQKISEWRTHNGYLDFVHIVSPKKKSAYYVQFSANSMIE